MNYFTATIAKIVDESESIKSFYFFLGSNKFDYLPGQFIQLNLDIKNCDERCNIRNYSIASSPTETAKNNLLRITTKFEASDLSAFKKNLRNLVVGDEIKIRGPFGRFILDIGSTALIVMLAGGIGITPFRNMVKYATDKKIKNPITLFYSNKTVLDTIWKEDLDKWSKINKNLKIIYILTNSHDKKTIKNFENTRIDKEMIAKYISDVRRSIYYVCGPTMMVDGMINTLKDLKIDLDKIHFERFTGY